MDKLENARKVISEADKAIAELFEKRMTAVRAVAEYKRERGLPVPDEAREAALIEKNSGYIVDSEIKEYYVDFHKYAMKVSRDFQHKLIDGAGTECGGTAEGAVKIHVDLKDNGYDIEISRGALDRVGELLSLDRKVMIVSDDGVPEEYVQCVARSCREPIIMRIPAGEESKSLACFEKILERMLGASFTRGDAVCAVGGGVCGDIAGFVASAYMRGIDFYNIPTTLLSQVDSSIGGKTAVNFCGVKNIVGAFYQPKKVVIDPNVLGTLPKRHLAAGMSEAIKMAATFDAELFSMLEAGDPYEMVDTVIERSLRIKKRVVELDERESGLRRALNFGHTVGHGIESASCGGLYHGEAVSLGMIPMCSDGVRARLLPVLKKAGLPTECVVGSEVYDAVSHDKKSKRGGIDVVLCDKIGTFTLANLTIDEIKERTAKAFADDIK